MAAQSKSFLSFLLALLLGAAPALVAQNILGYRAARLPDSTVAVYRVYDNGTQVRVARLPSDASRGRFAGRALLPYALETTPGQLNLNQFGLNKYFSPNYRFSVDLPGPFTVAQRRAQGVTLFSNLTQPESEKTTFPYGDGIRAVFEQNVLQGVLVGTGFAESDLATVESILQTTCPQVGAGNEVGNKYIYFNFEIGVFWKKESYLNKGTWEAKKLTSIVCESDGVTRTLEQLDASGLWPAEERVRIQNRYGLVNAITRQKSVAGTMISWATGLYGQLYPNLAVATQTSIPFEGTCDVSHIGGNAQGQITLNGRSYTLTGNMYEHEDFQMAYNYLYNFDITRADYNDIWVNKLPGTQNYPYLWGKIAPMHIVAFEKGYWQLLRYRMNARFSRYWPTMRLMAPVYEANAAGIVDGQYQNPEAARIPFAAMQETGGADQPKILQPPYLWYSRYITHRFLEGDGGAGSGFYMFPINPSQIWGDLSQWANFKTVLHCYTALYQARNDMQPYERFFAGSTLVEDPQVYNPVTTAYDTYNGTQAFAYDGGVTGTRRPAYSIRYKVQADGSYRVLVLGGMVQNWTDERTDIISVVGNLNNAKFSIKLRGPAAHVYEFVVPAGESNQTYTANFSAQTQWEKPGYGGRVGAATN